MKTLSLVISILMLLVSSCGKNDKLTNSGPSHSNTNAQIIVHDGNEREYIVYIPESYDGTSAVPLMLNFHGFGGNATDFMNYADMRSISDSDPFILVYPQGSIANGATHWNPCPVGAGNKSTADDLGFIESLINEITSQYNINNARVYAAGYSNGGMMAYGLAHYKSELIAAVASVSGVMLDCTGSTEHPMPIVHLHGTSDAVLPYNGSSFYPSTQNTLDYWIQFNNTNTTPTTNSDNSDGMTIEHYAYEQGDRSVSVEHYKYIGGDHIWFTSTFQGHNASELVWNFVSRYDLNGLR